MLAGVHLHPDIWTDCITFYLLFLQLVEMSLTSSANKPSFSGRSSFEPQPSTSVHVELSAEEVRDLLDGVDFSEPVLEGECPSPTSPSCVMFSNQCGNTSFLNTSDLSPACEEKEKDCFLESFYYTDVDLALLYHAVLDKGCKTCELCQEVTSKAKDRTFSTDYTREIPPVVDHVKDSIVYSFSRFANFWNAQPRDEFEWGIHTAELETATLYDPLEKEYWEWVQNEINYLNKCEEAYNEANAERKRTNEDWIQLKPSKRLRC